ncbi:hypothetical protein EMPS_00493 [Entomortierella parvispora]|uniref:Crinkler effector protein N-terminal domain-containing protein n=1 Tax=Entomortierella parvispora TaxID=205924 RepID=A0A9P3H1T9_9FUNG|nr:hypothetical protein EMPS_00493 [Entomortierella parvispora]
MSNESLEINCLFDGEPNPFPIIAKFSDSVGLLKGFIKTDNSSELGGVDTRRITLWRVTIPLTPLAERKPITLKGLQEVGSSAVELDVVARLHQIFDVQPPLTAVHIIVQVQTLSVSEIIKKIIVHATESVIFPSGDIMPLKDRDFTVAVDMITKNVKFRHENNLSKANFHMIVSGGAPGIGKTRFGKELFNHLKDTWIPPEWKGCDLIFKYLRMDFGSGIKLTEEDVATDNPDIIIGTRIAFCFFIEGRYELSFAQFRNEIKSNINMFTIGNVMPAITENFQLQGNRRLFLFLHVDEFQLIDRWDLLHKDKRNQLLFKEMIGSLAPLMQPPGSSMFVQVFLSGTASRAIIAAKDPSRNSFRFVSTPLLSAKSVREIAGHYAKKYKAEKCECIANKWNLCRHFLQLLEDTGGLPRALELLFAWCFQIGGNGEKFFREIAKQNFDAIFGHIKSGLEAYYSIHGTVSANKSLALSLLHASIVGRPLSRGTLMDPNNVHSSVAHLEEDSHIILEACNPAGTQFTIKMPLFFICLYNDVLQVVDHKIEERLRVQNDLHWQGWELFLACFDAFRNNLLIDLGQQTARLSDLYPGAFGTQSTLDLELKLKRLSVSEAKEQYPSETLTDRITAKNIDWKSGDNVIVNGKSAPWGDAFIVRETSQGQWTISIHQGKFDYNSVEFTSKDLSAEHQKNLAGSSSAKLKPESRKTLMSYHHIAIIFTTQPFDDEVKQDDRLVISMDNFKEYFGPVFASHANFALTQINPNFSERARIKEYIPGIGDANAVEVVEKRPFTSLQDFYRKFPHARTAIRKYEDNHPGKKIKLNFYPFE